MESRKKKIDWLVNVDVWIAFIDLVNDSINNQKSDIHKEKNISRIKYLNTEKK